MTHRLAAAAAGLIFAAGAMPPVSAAPLKVDQIQIANRHTVLYRCTDKRQLKVAYLNTSGEQSFALVPVRGKVALFVQVASASGTKYVADQYTWWTEGDEAIFEDESAKKKDGSPAGGVNCKSR